MCSLLIGLFDTVSDSSHGMIEWFGFKGTFKDHLVPISLPRAGTYPTRLGRLKPHLT